MGKLLYCNGDEPMKKVLIADDKAENRFLLETILGLDGYRIISARNGAEALGLIKVNKPDLIITDMLMPVMDGFTLCRECKKDETLKAIPFLFYTATYVDSKDEEYALSLGADRFILKPQPTEPFLKIVRDCLEEVKGKKIRSKEIADLPENVALKEYNEVLLRKIEDRMLHSEKAEIELRKYSEELEKEIIERKKTELALQNSQKLFQTLSEVSPVGIFRTTPEGRTTYVNPRWSELSGATSEEALDNKWLNIVHPDDREKLINDWQSDVKQKKQSDAEYRFLRKDGKIIWVIGTAVPEWNGDELIGYIGTITDITNIKNYEIELTKAKEKAEGSDKLKTAFLNNISHEVRTPMNAIVGFSNLILDSSLTPEVLSDYVQMIVQNCNHLLSIITQIVNMATIESGQEKVYRTEISLNQIMKLLYEQYIADIKKKNLLFSYHCALPDGADKLTTDETKLIQIISNLISNALKFTRAGSIGFGYELKDNHLEFNVRDTGIGIPAGMHEAVFERFRQVENSQTREYEGSGLGLSISKAYIELLGGKIWLTSAPGEGSTFYFSIPYDKVSVTTKAEKKARDKSKFVFKNPVTILVAEDENNNYLLLYQYLSNANIVVLHAVNGSEAVEICNDNSQIDLVLMDLKMPVMDGFEATRRIKKLRPYLPVIAQTAYVNYADKSLAVSAGCTDLLSKPYTRDELFTMIREHLLTE